MILLTQYYLPITVNKTYMIWIHEKLLSDGKLVILNFTIHRINHSNLLCHLHQSKDKCQSINQSQCLSS